MILSKKIKKVRAEQKKLLNQRLKQFQAMRKAPNNELFSELCYCLLTANFNAKRTLMIQQELTKGFLSLPERELALELRRLGHRFPNARANYIVKARSVINNLKGLFKLDGSTAREWLVKNVKGIGMKEASHYLRNIGFTDVAIIDFHIIDLLVREGLIKKPNSLTKSKYLEIEEILKSINNNLAELDLILWFIETKKILK